MCNFPPPQNGRQHGRQNEMLAFLHQIVYTIPLPLLRKKDMCIFPKMAAIGKHISVFTVWVLGETLVMIP